MPTGLWTFEKGEGRLQLTNDQKYFIPVEQGTVDYDAGAGGGWTTDTYANSRIKDFTFNGISSDEEVMIVLWSNAGVWYTNAGATATSRTIRVSLVISGPAPQFKYFVFVNRRPPPNPSGMTGLELYHEGELFYASNTPILKVLGTQNQDGYDGIPYAGKTIGFVPMKQRKFSAYAQTYNPTLGSCTLSGGYPGYQMYLQENRNAIGIKTSDGTVGSEDRFMQYGPIPYTCSSTAGGHSTIQNITKWSILVVDLTDFF